MELMLQSDFLLNRSYQNYWNSLYVYKKLNLAPKPKWILMEKKIYENNALA
jgi:hypothetical protein